MAVLKVLVDNAVRAKLGKEGLFELCRNLHLMACQTCGAALDEAPPPVLVVDDYGIVVQGVLHHQTCEEPRFISHPAGAQPRLSDRPHLAYSGLAGVIVDPTTALPTRLPYVVLNPHMETALVTHNPDGTWTFDTVARFVRRGMHEVDSAVKLGAVVPDLTVRLHPQAAGTYELVICDAGSPEWTLPGVGPYVATYVCEQRGLFLVATTAVLPQLWDEYPLEGADFCDLLHSGEVAVGWVPLDP